MTKEFQYRPISYEEAETGQKALLRYITRPATNSDDIRRIWNSKEAQKEAEWSEWRNKLMEIATPDILVNSSQLPTMEEAEENIRSALDRRREENRARSRILMEDAQAATRERDARSELCRKISKNIEDFSEEIHMFMARQDEIVEGLMRQNNFILNLLQQQK